jgi:hypothetical protein
MFVIDKMPRGSFRIGSECGFEVDIKRNIVQPAEVDLAAFEQANVPEMA